MLKRGRTEPSRSLRPNIRPMFSLNRTSVHLYCAARHSAVPSRWLRNVRENTPTDGRKSYYTPLNRVNMCMYGNFLSHRWVYSPISYRTQTSRWFCSTAVDVCFGTRSSSGDTALNYLPIICKSLQLLIETWAGYLWFDHQSLTLYNEHIRRRWRAVIGLQARTCFPLSSWRHAFSKRL